MKGLRHLAWDRYRAFCYGIRYLSLRFPGASCSSWGRSVKHNAALPGSVPDSEHLEWTAADLVWDPGTEPDPGALAAAAREVGLEAQREADHWHVQLYTKLT